MLKRSVPGFPEALFPGPLTPHTHACTHVHTHTVPCIRVPCLPGLSAVFSGSPSPPGGEKSRPRNLEGSDGRAGHVAIVDTSSRGFLGMGIARGGVEPGRPLLYLRGVQVTSKGPFLLKADENLGRRCTGLRTLPLPRLAAVLRQASRSHL